MDVRNAPLNPFAPPPLLDKIRKFHLNVISNPNHNVSFHLLPPPNPTISSILHYC